PKLSMDGLELWLKISDAATPPHTGGDTISRWLPRDFSASRREVHFISPVPTCEFASISALHECPVRRSGQPMRLRRILRRKLQLCLRDGRKSKRSLPNDSCSNGDRELQAGNKRLHLPSGMGRNHSHGHRGTLL